jgi:uncharacterized membrane protein YeiH
MEFPSPASLRSALDLAGVVVAAISGALAAGRKSLDLIGVAVVAVVTAIGGGTLRDILLGRPIFWLTDTRYLATILIAAAGTVLYTRFRRPPDRALLIADAFALGLFAVTGAQVADTAHLAGLLVVLMGTMTATAGGAIRDVLLREIPLVMQGGYLYATAAIAGTGLYATVRELGFNHSGAALVGIAVTIGIRLAAIAWRVRLPVYRLEDPGPT